MSNFSAENEIVNLNIGGTCLTTTRTTLLSIPNTFFHGLLDLSYTPQTVNGAIFIDRDPTPFKYILENLRHHGELSLPTDTTLWEDIEREADFYGVTFIRPPTCTNCDQVFSPQTNDRCRYHSGTFKSSLVISNLGRLCTNETHRLGSRCNWCDGSRAPKLIVAEQVVSVVNKWSCCESADAGARGCVVGKHVV
ncbi:BTB/POZ protein [Endogone sp. FLAS-F59071]|nr:BTB/POZ protein [Endogone sp. FLAS-F59071]|eukprot:RUS22000.1 BTB/POZ protein [Endogone sp. FLAS-F59071]